MIEYTHDQLEHAAQAHAKRRAELFGPEPAERPIWMRQPEWQRRCIYCGTVVSHENTPCCKEVHNDEQPECPACGEDVDVFDKSIHGIESTVYKCTDCNWESDPE